MGSVKDLNGVNLVLEHRLIFCVRGLPKGHRAPVASHLVVWSCRPVYWLNRCSFLSCIFRLSMDPAVILMSSAYSWSSYVIIVALDLCGLYDDRYPLLPMASRRNIGSMKIVKRKGDRVSPCSVPLRI